MKEGKIMKIRKSDEKGFTLIEVIVTLVLVGITAALAGMWIVSIANGYIFAKMNASTLQKGQLAMTRLTKEFTSIRAVTAWIPPNTITYDRTDSALGLVTGQTVQKSGSLLQLKGNTLTDNVSAFTLAYCDDTTPASCQATWSSTSRIIEINLTLTAADSTPVTFTQRVTPRNL
jgi:prepilin-type N-terminal cleavage/methylation domain-containing protein